MRSGTATVTLPAGNAPARAGSIHATSMEAARESLEVISAAHGIVIVPLSAIEAGAFCVIVRVAAGTMLCGWTVRASVTAAVVGRTLEPLPPEAHPPRPSATANAARAKLRQVCIPSLRNLVARLAHYVSLAAPMRVERPAA